MDERNRRVIESMALTGMEFDDLKKTFSQFPIDEIEKIYMSVHKERDSMRTPPEYENIKCNCS